MKTTHLLLIITCIVVCGCTKRHYGPELTEPAEVFETAFVPRGHGTGAGIGISTSGNVSVVSSNIDIPERYAVVFKCQHGKFVIDGQRGEDLYKRFQRGDKVLVRYCEVIETHDGEARAVDLHFLGATRRHE